MNKLIVLTTALTLMASSAMATYYPEQTVEEPPVKCCDNPGPEPEVDTTNRDRSNIVMGLIAIVTVGILMNSRKTQSMPQGTLVEPEPDYNKILEQVGQ